MTKFEIFFIESPGLLGILWGESFPGSLLAYGVAWIIMTKKKQNPIKIKFGFIVHLILILITSTLAMFSKVMTDVIFGTNVSFGKPENPAVGFYTLILPGIIAAILMKTYQERKGEITEFLFQRSASKPQSNYKENLNNNKEYHGAANITEIASKIIAVDEDQKTMLILAVDVLDKSSLDKNSFKFILENLVEFVADLYIELHAQNYSGNKEVKNAIKLQLIEVCYENFGMTNSNHFKLILFVDKPQKTRVEAMQLFAFTSLLASRTSADLVEKISVDVSAKMSSELLGFDGTEFELAKKDLNEILFKHSTGDGKSTNKTESGHKIKPSAEPSEQNQKAGSFNSSDIDNSQLVKTRKLIEKVVSNFGFEYLYSGFIRFDKEKNPFFHNIKPSAEDSITVKVSTLEIPTDLKRLLTKTKSLDAQEKGELVKYMSELIIDKLKSDYLN